MGSKEIKKYEVVIIGGGIVGAGIFRDLSLHNVATLLVERGDFSSQTSQSSSKMLHGGIRYLENYDFSLVWEALHEKNHWLKVAPHLAQEKYFYLPVFNESKYPLWMVRIGLWLYDLLSWFKNKPHKSLNAAKTITALPGIKTDGLKGSGVYSDAIIDDSKLGLECIYDSLENPQMKALNYHQIIAQQTLKNGHYSITIENVFTNEQQIVECQHLVFATGPFTDQVLKKLNIPWTPKMLLSKGSHIWLRETSLKIKNPMVLQTKDLRIIFVIPQRHAILVGTTEEALKPDTDIFNIQASQAEINYLLDNLNEYFPHEKLTEDDILSSFAGVRPLVQDGSSSRGKTSRKHLTLEPKDNLHVIIGGKYTTFRVMAADIAKKIIKRSGRRYNQNLSLSPLKRTSIVNNIHNSTLKQETIKQIIEKEMPKTKEDILVRRLSAPGLKHCPIPELIESLLEEVTSSLETIRKSHDNSRS